ncbi:MAG: glycosyltransferase family 4 protein [Chthoniobacter sp.]|uniref:glycosyltransferase family 4 protein n=1 Tax=Chthoniobacter sp. TaxID=2510640 RepID=UPI0032AB505E
MKIVLLTPGTGSYHCGVCMRDNALAKELHRQGHDALMLPMYLPLTLDEDAASPDMPIFFGGVSVYLRQKIPWLRHMPHWLDRLLANRALLRLVAGKAAARTGGPDVAELTLSMLRGELGNQAGEIEELIAWLREHGRPDAIWISTALQAGLARRIKAELGVPVLGFLQGEDAFIDGLGAPWSERVWTLLSERMRDTDRWIAPSQYFAELMAQRLGWSAAEREQRIQVVPNGISLDGYGAAPEPPPQVIGYLARFIPGKGLGLLVNAFIALKKRGRFPQAKLRCAGSMTEHDTIYVETLQAHLRTAGFEEDVEWHPNVSREEKITFLEGLTLFSVPATYGEAFGMYVIEALAAGVPVVLPNTAAFPELVESTGGGLLFTLAGNDAGDAERLADALESLLAAPEQARALGASGRAAIQREYTISRLAERLAAITREMIDAPQPVH